MSSTTNRRFFIIDLTKTEIDSIQEQLLKEMDELLDKVRKGLVDNNNNKTEL